MKTRSLQSCLGALPVFRVSHQLIEGSASVFNAADGETKKVICEELQLIRERLQQALIDFDQCFVGTIRSFCASLLRERPVEAGLNPEFEELDGAEERALQDQAWESYLLEVKLNASERLARL